jgi:hypothetical protein
LLLVVVVVLGLMQHPGAVAVLVDCLRDMLALLLGHHILSPLVLVVVVLLIPMVQMALLLFLTLHLLVHLLVVLWLLAVVEAVKMQLPQIREAHQVVAREAQVLQHHQEFLDKEILGVRVLVEALNLAVVEAVLEQKE